MMPGRMEFEFSAASRKQSPRRQDAPLVLQVLGDFGSHENDPNDPSLLMQVPVRTVDLDNIEELWSHFSPRLDLQIDEHSVSIEPQSMDDFHPDYLFQNLPLFANLRALRKRLLDPASNAEALAEITSSLMDSDAANSQPAPEPSDEKSRETGADMLDRLLGSSQRPERRESAERSAIDHLLHKAVAAHIVQEADPKVDSAIVAVDLAISDFMRRILHHPQFQSLEGSWRSLFDLVYGSELGEEVVLRVCSISKQALLAGLPKSAEDVQQCGLYQLLFERDRRAADDTGFGLLFCNYFFAANVNDVALLATLASLAELNDAAVIGAADSSLAGSPSLVAQPDPGSWDAVDNSYWQQLRGSPQASRIALALPRVLGRLPYGGSYEQVINFEFEESLPSQNGNMPPHNHFLWVNPSMYLAGLIARSFSQRGWDMSPDDHTDITSLPVFTFQSESGDAEMLPTAEVWLPERAAVAILQLGLIPVVSFRNRDIARVVRFQSIANPLASLKGPW